MRAMSPNFVFFIALAAWLGASVCGKDLDVKHEPRQPKSGQVVTVTVRSDAAQAANGFILEYQIVDPGKYIARKDAQFEKNWVALPMEKTSDGRVWKAELPGTLQTHRRLIRYRIASAKDKKRLAPLAGDAQPNFAYFVYDGVPDWKASIDASSREPKLRQTVTYPAAELQKVPVYHFISHKKSVENVTWNHQKPFFQREGRNAYDYTGTLVYDGVVYDHVEFRARGGEWRHAMGKNMWKFNFLPGHRLQARDNFGRPYETKWDKLNLGACIQQGDTGLRGEQGLFEAVGFKLFNLAGVPAPRTHWVHLRIIDETDEAPRDQYAGDFWGLYLATENPDGHFVKEHRLPAGNLYKMDAWGPRPEFIGSPALSNQFNVLQFAHRIQPQQPDAWWQQTVDLQSYYSYRAVIEAIHHYDVAMGKNYYYFLDPNSHKWTVLPWDIDLTWSDTAFGTGGEPFNRAGVLRRETFKTQYQQRVAELRDLLFNPEQMNQLIEECANVIGGAPGAASIAAADRAKWDYHPALSSRQSNSGKAGQGRFYFGDANNDLRTMATYMKSYAAKRMRYLDGKILADYAPPAAPKISAVSPENLRFRTDDAAAGACEWRLAEAPSLKAGQPGSYEIVVLWQRTLKGGDVAEIPLEAMKPGQVYRVRARRQDAAGRWSRWSSPVQFTAPSN
jgi:hypothetical protein